MNMVPSVESSGLKPDFEGPNTVLIKGVEELLESAKTWISSAFFSHICHGCSVVPFAPRLGMI